MTEAGERRAVPRTRLADGPPARVRDLRVVRLLDLSLAGAQIAHLAALRLGAACALELPPPGEGGGGNCEEISGVADAWALSVLSKEARLGHGSRR